MVSNKYQGDNIAFPESIEQCQPSNTEVNKKEELEKAKIEIEEGKD